MIKADHKNRQIHAKKKHNDKETYTVSFSFISLLILLINSVCAMCLPRKIDAYERKRGM